MIKLIILILRRCYARSSLPLKSNASMFSFRAQSPFDTESSTDNSEDETNSMESSEDDVSVAKKTGTGYYEYFNETLVPSKTLPSC